MAKCILCSLVVALLLHTLFHWVQQDIMFPRCNLCFIVCVFSVWTLTVVSCVSGRRAGGRYTELRRCLLLVRAGHGAERRLPGSGLPAQVQRVPETEQREGGHEPRERGETGSGQQPDRLLGGGSAPRGQSYQTGCGSACLCHMSTARPVLSLRTRISTKQTCGQYLEWEVAVSLLLLALNLRCHFLTSLKFPPSRGGRCLSRLPGDQSGIMLDTWCQCHFFLRE